MENEKSRTEDDAPKTKPTSLEKERGETAVLRKVSEVRIDVESGTITLKLAAKK